jgi:hypothetical protein
VIQASLDILGTGVRGDDPKLNSILKNAGDRLDHANSREKQHFEAIKLCNEGRFEPALEIWDKLIATQAWDVLALKFYSDVYVLHHIITVLNEFLDQNIFSCSDCFPLILEF